jgi:hypothetical protein
VGCGITVCDGVGKNRAHAPVASSDNAMLKSHTRWRGPESRIQAADRPDRTRSAARLCGWWIRLKGTHTFYRTMKLVRKGGWPKAFGMLALVGQPHRGADLAELTCDLAPRFTGVVAHVHLTEQAECEDTVCVGGMRGNQRLDPAVEWERRAVAYPRLPRIRTVPEAPACRSEADAIAICRHVCCL